MKRFINSYNVHRAISIILGIDINLENLALWTIIMLRWPDLAEFLYDHPENVEYIGSDNDLNDLSDLDEIKQLKPLFRNSAVIKVIKGENIGSFIDKNTIVKCNFLSS